MDSAPMLCLLYMFQTFFSQSPSVHSLATLVLVSSVIEKSKYLRGPVYQYLHYGFSKLRFVYLITCS